MCKFHICAKRHILQKYGHKVIPIRGLAVYFWPCEKGSETSRDIALLGKGFGHVYFSTVLADGCCLKAYVPPSIGYGLLKDYLW